ncbi:MAG: hypothetical protein U0990_12715 [Candidatus Nanopelagicales bacterium]|nr:hypothetical protein [Candidatus Nanopelagicales bacterium]
MSELVMCWKCDANAPVIGQILCESCYEAAVVLLSPLARAALSERRVQPSRSQQRRIARQQGEPAPELEAQRGSGETIQEIEVGGIRWRYVSWDEWPPALSQYFESSDTWAPVAHGGEAAVLWDALVLDDGVWAAKAGLAQGNAESWRTVAAGLATALRAACEGCETGLEAKQANGSGHVNPSHTGVDKFEFPDEAALHDFPDGMWDMCLLTPARRAALAAYDALVLP